MRKIGLLALATIFIFGLLLVVGCGDAKKQSGDASSQDAGTQTSTQNTKSEYVIGLANGFYGNEWMSKMTEDIEKKAKELKDQGILKDLVIQNTGGVPDQIAALNNMINKDVNAIIIYPSDPAALAPTIKKAQDKGITIVSMTSTTWPNVVTLDSDDESNMSIITQWMIDQLNGKGKIIYLSGVPGLQADVLRTKTIKSILANNSGIELVGEAPGFWSSAKAQSAMATLLATNSKIDGVLTQDAQGLGVLQAYKASGKPVPPLSGDYSFGYLRQWSKMNLNSIAYVVPPGFGADALSITVKLLQGYKVKDSILRPNFIDPKLGRNELIIPTPYYVVNKLDPNAAWMKYVSPLSKVLTLDEALKMGEGQPDSGFLDYVMTDKEIESFFEPK